MSPSVEPRAGAAWSQRVVLDTDGIDRFYELGRGVLQPRVPGEGIEPVSVWSSPAPRRHHLETEPVILLVRPIAEHAVAVKTAVVRGRDRFGKDLSEDALNDLVNAPYRQMAQADGGRPDRSQQATLG